MPDDSTEDAEIHRVRREVRSFKHHALVYFTVIGSLMILNLLGGGGFWFIWPAVVWGAFLGLHAMSVFGAEIGQEWEDRMVEKVLERRRQAGAAPKHEAPPQQPPKPAPPSNDGPPPTP